jgi:hypoxanthine-guanine phosphoribosyltransferase
MRLADKPHRRDVEIVLDSVGFSVDDLFVVGYGTDLPRENIAVCPISPLITE